jgi:hypothetical protein
MVKRRSNEDSTLKGCYVVWDFPLKHVHEIESMKTTCLCVEYEVKKSWLRIDIKTNVRK